MTLDLTLGPSVGETDNDRNSLHHDLPKYSADAIITGAGSFWMFLVGAAKITGFKAPTESLMDRVKFLNLILEIGVILPLHSGNDDTERRPRSSVYNNDKQHFMLLFAYAVIEKQLISIRNSL